MSLGITQTRLSNIKSMKMLSFKVCLKNIDEQFDDEIKRFDMKEDECNLENILLKLEQTFPVLLEHQYYLSWVDQEGDKVTISEDSDLGNRYLSLSN